MLAQNDAPTDNWPAPVVPADVTVPALVLNVGSMALHHGSVGIIRSLGRMGVPVYAVVEDRFTPSAVSRYLTGAFVWDTRGLDCQHLLEGLTTIGQRLNQPTVLIPTSDLASVLIAENADILRRWFLFPDQATKLPRTLADKRELYRLCERLGVPFPLTVFPKSVDGIHQFVARAGYPVVVKAGEPWSLPAGARTTSIASCSRDLAAIIKATESQGWSNLLVQEYIDPAGGEDWFYHGYRNDQSGYAMSFTGRKLRSYPVTAGPTTLGKAVANERLCHQAENLLKAISYAGVCDLDYRLDSRDGQFKLLDFNPRIGAQFRLFEADGLDLPRALYLDLTGNDVPPCKPINDRIFVAEFHDLAASLAQFRRGKLGLREWKSSLAGNRELAWFSRDDLRPFLAMCLRLSVRVGQRLLRLKQGASSVVNRTPQFVRTGNGGIRR
jgi:predicted ATP-grasp superfamily ATP-dependent carboligase